MVNRLIVISGDRGCPTSFTDVAMPAMTLQVSYLSYNIIPIEIGLEYIRIYWLHTQIPLANIIVFVLVIKLNLFPAVQMTGAEEITQENRYVCIATSGGLNQQRTGVKFFLIQNDALLCQVDGAPKISDGSHISAINIQLVHIP